LARHHSFGNRQHILKVSGEKSICYYCNIIMQY